MSAEVLRRAASLMRERAEAAYPRARGLCDDWFDAGASDLAHLRPQEAEHIASWHPAVALAVADLLEDGATYLDYVAEKHSADARGDEGQFFLAVARAYLNEEA